MSFTVRLANGAHLLIPGALNQAMADEWAERLNEQHRLALETREAARKIDAFPLPLRLIQRQEPTEEEQRRTALRRQATSERNWRIFDARYFDRRTFRDIAAEWEISSMRVSQIYHRCLRRLRLGEMDTTFTCEASLGNSGE